MKFACVGPDTYWFCFDGIEKGSILAISTLGVKKEKDFFLMGYNEMLRKINPSVINLLRQSL